MPEIEEWYQRSLDPFTGVEGEDLVKLPQRRRQRGLGMEKCRHCHEDIHILYEENRIDEGKIALDPGATADGEWYILQKIAHRKRPCDNHPNLVFFRRHRCLDFMEIE